MNRTVSRIKKRDGAVTDFVQEKITNAIYNAMQANGLSDKQIAKNISDIATFMLEDKFAGYTIPSVEQIQDIVEMVLMKQGYHDIAKSYILYRNRHKDIREAGEIGINLERLIKDYINDRDWKVKENSNEGVTSFSGLNARVAGEVLANFALNQLYSEKIKKAHNEGALHIHDLSYPIVGYCAGWSLENLLKKGFGHVPNQVHSFPAKHLETATLHMVNFIGTMQGEFAGAQAFSSVDTFLAPFIRTDNLEYENVKQDIQKLIFGLNVPSRWGWQTPFSNLTFDWTVPKDMKERCVIVGGEEKNFTYGECQGEMDMINKAFLELMIEGDQKGRVFTFPIPTYNLTRDFDWDSSNADLLFNVTAALVAVAGTIITEALNYSVFKFVTDFKLFKKSLQKKTVSRIVNLFNKAPFTAIWIAGLTPIPFYPIRFLVVLAHYPLIKYLLAVFLSRLPRFFILALIGYAIKIPDYLLIVLFVVLIISIYIPVLRNLIKKKKNKNRGDID